MLEVAGRVAMVSGAARGIGRAIMDRLRAEGWRISAGVRSARGLAEAPDLMIQRYEADDPGSAEDWAAATVARFGRVDALVNAAGINPMARMLDADETAHDAMWRVNVKGPMRAIRAAWPQLVASGEGRVVNVASLSGKRVANENTGYAMSKFALVALTQEVRRQGFEHGIRAMALCPGFVATDMTAGANWPREKMSSADDIAVLVATVMRLPNNATVGELRVNCRFEALV